MPKTNENNNNFAHRISAKSVEHLWESGTPMFFTEMTEFVIRHADPQCMADDLKRKSAIVIKTDQLEPQVEEGNFNFRPEQWPEVWALLKRILSSIQMEILPDYTTDETFLNASKSMKLCIGFGHRLDRLDQFKSLQI